MDGRMIEAAQTGNINVLYESIQNDPYILERLDQVPFLDTPLHVAAYAGHVNFVMEMMNLRPSFARKLNQAGFSPMHLALQNNQTQAVLRLLKVDKDLVRVKGREGLTPLLHVVRTANLDLMIKFLEVCPDAIEDVTVRDETAFHLALKNNMFEVFEVLVGWLIRSRHEAAQRWEKELLSWGDIEGNTVLHIAAIKNELQVVKVLLEHLCQADINAKNLEGLTALDIQSQCPGTVRLADNREIIDMLRKAGGLLPNNPNSSTNINESFRPKTSYFQKFATMLFNNPNSSTNINESFRPKMSYFQKFATMAGRGRNGLPNELRSTFLVVTVLIITATYDASLNPPKTGDNNSFQNDLVSLSRQSLSSYTSLEKTGSTAPMPSVYRSEVSESARDWTDIVDVSCMFWMYNTFTFWVAIGLTAYLLPTPTRSICLLLLVTLSLFGSCYMLLVVVSSWSWRLQYHFFFGNITIPISYHALSIVNYCLSTVLAVLASFRITSCVSPRFVSQRKIFCLVQVFSFLSFAFILAPAILNAETILKFSH